MKKILASALAAAMILANVNVFAEQKVEKNYLLQEDFSNFQNGGNFENDRIDKWRVEGGKDGWNGDLSTDELNVEDIAGMEKALVLKNTSNIIRGGKGWEADKNILPGEKFTVECDVQVENSSNFYFGLVNSASTNGAEEHGKEAPLFLTKSNGDENLYIGWGQNTYDASIDVKIPNVVFKRNEVNHIKAEYTLNTDVSSKTKDTLTVTVTNSNGTTSGTVEPNYRWQYGGNPPPIEGVRGIQFFKNDITTKVYLDNIEVYRPVDTSVPELIEDYAEFSDENSNKYTDTSAIPAEVTTLVLTYDSAIKEVKEGAVKITYGKNKEIPVTVSAEGYKVKVAIDSSLIPGFEYTVSIDSSKVIATSGNAMKEDESFKFTVAGEESGGAVIDGYVRNYYLQDDFSNFQNGSNADSNNRLDAWRIEGGINWNGDLPSAYLSIVDKDTMQGALKMGGEGFDGIIRGGRRYASTIGAGESYTVEFDFYADEDAEFSIGQISEQETWRADDAATHSYFFHIKPIKKGDSETLYYYTDQGMTDAANNSIAGVVFKRNEVNHFKIDYDINENVSYGTRDTMKITVTNSYGTTSGTVSPNYRYKSDSNKPLTGVQGLSFFKWNSTPETEIYIDNLEVYSQYEDVEPKVTSLTFAHSDESIEKDPTKVNADVSEIKLNFNTAMKYAAEYFDLTDSNGNRVEYTNSYSKGGTVLNVVLPNMLKNDETYTLTVSAGALSKAGNALSKDYTYTFKTNAGGEMVIENFNVAESVDANANTTTVTTSAELVKTFEGKQQYSLYIMAFDADKKLVDIGYKAITMDSFGKGDFTKEITVANQDKVKTIKAVLCTYPSFKVVDIKTITR